jgi:hypothetical protein
VLLHLDLAKGTIARYYSSLNGTLNDGLSKMFNPCLIFTPCLQHTPGTSLVPQRTKDLVKNICDVMFKLISNTTENNMLRSHLLVDLKQVFGKK